jgi:anti-sigma-K factor RskA
MFEEDQDTLAAEYVLGTLSADERGHAEALLSFDPGFEAAVRQWERRLGELNVMVEAVEPPAEVWDKIKKEIGPQAAPAADLPRDLHEPSLTAALAPDLLPSGLAPEPAPPPPPPLADQVADAIFADGPVVTPERGTPAIERGADVVYLASRDRRWQRAAIGFGAIAALLAIYVAVSQIAPDLLPGALRPADGVVRADGSGRLPPDRLVAVLQQQPTAPAFLVTLDIQHRTLFVRRVSATPEANRSYELWLISSRFPTPRSLGLVGGEDFTQRSIPGNYDLDTLRGALYAVSLEPPGGSPSGTPSGPVLFTGKAIEALPASPANPAKT